nr:MAG TPA: hypothetical protein [Caudoviricetes sp.]DAZ53099.1 MAG TPA: hypothetical protein [Caudoviricetes sp.]
MILNRCKQYFLRDNLKITFFGQKECFKGY